MESIVIAKRPETTEGSAAERLPDLTRYTGIRVVERELLGAAMDEDVLAILPPQDVVTPVTVVNPHRSNTNYSVSDTLRVDAVVRKTFFLVGVDKESAAIAMTTRLAELQGKVSTLLGEQATLRADLKKAESAREQLAGDLRREAERAKTVERRGLEAQDRVRAMEADLAKVRQEIGHAAFRAIVGAPAAPPAP